MVITHQLSHACFADVPEEKAANIALGTVASKARAALIDACAAYREQDSQVTATPLLQAFLPIATLRKNHRSLCLVSLAAPPSSILHCSNRVLEGCALMGLLLRTDT